MISFEIVSPANVCVRTFDTSEAARNYVLAHKLTLPGLSVVQVTTTVERTAIYTPRRKAAA